MADQLSEFQELLKSIDDGLVGVADSLIAEGYSDEKRLRAASREGLLAVNGIQQGDADLIISYFNKGGPIETLAPVLKEIVDQVTRKFEEVCDTLVMRIARQHDVIHQLTGRGAKRQQDAEEASDESEDQQDDVALDADTAWQARENAYHEDLVELLRQPRMYRALGLSGPPDHIRHATLEERISNMRVLP